MWFSFSARWTEPWYFSFHPSYYMGIPEDPPAERLMLRYMLILHSGNNLLTDTGGAASQW